jgi:hypothetical protein
MEDRRGSEAKDLTGLLPQVANEPDTAELKIRMGSRLSG